MTTATKFNTLGTLKVELDYRRSIPEMVLAGHYAKVLPFINAENFPTHNQGTVAQVEFLFIEFEEDIPMNLAFVLMEEFGIRPAVLIELLAAGETGPDLLAITGGTFNALGSLAPNSDLEGLFEENTNCYPIITSDWELDFELLREELQKHTCLICVLK